MKSSKLTNSLLALIFLILLAHLAIPMFIAHDASAAGSDAIPPAAVAASAGFPALDKVAAEVGNGLDGIAKSNQQIADAIREHGRSNAQIARSLQDVANALKGLASKAPARASAPSSRNVDKPESSEDETNPDWWRQYLDE